MINGDQDIERSVTNHTIANSDCMVCEIHKNLRENNMVNQIRYVISHFSKRYRNISPKSDLSFLQRVSVTLNAEEQNELPRRK